LWFTLANGHIPKFLLKLGVSVWNPPSECGGNMKPGN